MDNFSKIGFILHFQKKMKNFFPDLEIFGPIKTENNSLIHTKKNQTQTMTGSFFINKPQIKRLQNAKRNLYISLILGGIFSIITVNYTEAPMPYTKAKDFKIPTYHFEELVSNTDANHKTGGKHSLYKK
jgi:hypothetical protein